MRGDTATGSVRETIEEIGISFSETSLRDLKHVSAYYDNTNRRAVLVTWFLTECCNLTDLALEQEERVEYRWATYDEAQYELLWQTQQRALRIAHNLITKSKFIRRG